VGLPVRVSAILCGPVNVFPVNELPGMREAPFS
jgi:hypothetical protein